MEYAFPVIKTLDDVLPHISGHDEFFATKKDDYTVVNYSVAFQESFAMESTDDAGGAVRRECRGLIFDNDGNIMSRPFHKFFNVGEREETLVRNIDLNAQHVIMEKMDGSMIRPVMTTGKIRLGTKMGVTDTSILAEKCVKPEQLAWMEKMMKIGMTPVFEYISPRNRIVIEYDREELVLLAVRDNHTGEYASFDRIRELGGEEFFSLVPVYGSVDGSLDDYIARQRGREGREGDVIAVGNMRYKIKNDWYVRIHKVKDKIRSYRHILAIILDNGMDDIYPHLDEADHAKVSQFETDFHAAYQAKLQFLETAASSAVKRADGNRKVLATEILPNSNVPKTEWCFVFNYADGKDLNTMLMQHVRKSVSSTAKYIELAKSFGLDVDNAADE